MTRAQLQLSAVGLRASFSDSYSGKYKLRIGGTMPGGPVGFYTVSVPVGVSVWLAH